MVEKELTVAGYTDSDLTMVQRKIAEGVTKVRFADGREVTYASVQELMGVERLIKAQLAAARRGRRAHFPCYRSGL
nr:hypothetical protein [Sphingomonas sp. Y57]